MNDISKRNQGSPIQVISRAADILRLLGRDTHGLSLGQIAQEVDLPRSTVQRIVSALTLEGFISHQNRDGSIRLGPQIQQLARASGFDMKERMQPVMKSLSEATGETVDLAILENGKMLFIAQVEGSQRLRTVSKINDRFPLTNTANGKAALASLSNDMAMQLINSEIEPIKSNSKTRQKLLKEIEDIKAGAIAIDENEHSDGICAFGVAVKDENGDVFALSIPVPSTRFEREKSTLTAAIKQHLSGLNFST